jgi:hypothetical protein
MSTLTAAVTGWLSLFRFTTVRQFTKAGALTIGALVFALGLYAIEKYALRLEDRFVENPTDIMVRAFGIAHFLVGWLFLFSSPRLRSWPSVGRLLAAIAVGVCFCLLFAQYGAMRNPYLAMLFFAYFLVHEVRDETTLYRIYEGVPTAIGPALGALCRTMLLVSMALVVWAYLAYAMTQRRTDFLVVASPQVLASLVAGISVLALISFRKLVHAARAEAGSLREFLAAHQPLLVVYAWLLLVLVAGSLLGTTGLNLVIILHVAAWVFFTSHQLSVARSRSSGSDARIGLWHWLRGTPAGFLTLHLGLLAAVLALLAVRVHVWQKVGLVSQMLASDAFCYWSIMHITMAFWTAGKR